jgi:hypothetical protein
MKVFGRATHLKSMLSVSWVVFTLRHLTTSLLGVLLLVGHLPAWIHVANCHDPACQLNSTAPVQCKAAHSCCSHCSRQVTNQANQKSNVGESNLGESCPPNAPDCPSHDSDHCSVCQSLATPFGFPSSHTAPIVVSAASHRAWLPPNQPTVSSIQSLPHSRGPPILGV